MVSHGLVVVNQLTSDRTPRNLYARTGEILLLYEGTGGLPELALTGFKSERFGIKGSTSHCPLCRIADLTRASTVRQRNQMIAIERTIEALASRAHLLLGWLGFRAVSSAVRASRLHREGPRFNPVTAHQVHSHLWHKIQRAVHTEFEPTVARLKSTSTYSPKFIVPT